jgi:acyl-CoA synthetase (AMP-forming)/AMP-acid ligase II
MYIGIHLVRAAKLHPKRIAVVDYSIDKRFTYKELNERVNRLANGLMGLGLKKGDRVADLMFNCHNAIETEGAYCKTGMVKVAINSRLSTQEIIQQLNNSEASALVIHPKFFHHIVDNRSEIKTVKHFIAVMDPQAGMLDYEKLLAGSSVAEPEVEVDLDDLYKLQYTSGTTGVLKAAMMTHRNYLVRLKHYLMMSSISPGHPVVQAYIAPVTHAAGGFVWVTYVQGGINLLLNMNPFTPKGLLEIIEKERVTDIFLIPVMINMLLDYPDLKKYDFSSLKSIGYGTAPMAPDRIKQAIKVFGPILRQGFGQTESSAIATTLYPQDHVTNGDPAREKRLASVGLTAVDAELRIVDEEGKDLPAGEVGEIILRGDFVMKGYWKSPERTADTIKNGWLYTRDMGYLDEAGYLFLTDRKSDMIISGGFNIYPTEVENALMEHKAVFEAAAVGVPDDVWGEAVKAVVVLKPGAKATEAELIEHCKERLASFKKPKSVDIVESLPKSPVGKIMRRVIREPYWQGRTRRVN